MEESQAWTNFGDLMDVILTAKEEGNSRIKVAVLVQGDDFDCQPSDLVSESPDQSILQLLKGKAERIISRLLITQIPFIITEDESLSLIITFDALPS